MYSRSCLGLLVTALVGLTLAACDGATPIGGGEDSPPPDLGSSPDMTLRPPLSEVQVTNTSAGVSAPGIMTNAGTKDLIVGQATVVSLRGTSTVRRIVLTAIGSASGFDVTNIRLRNGGVPLGSAVQLVNNQAIFDFARNPLVLLTGQAANLVVRADVLGGVNRYFQLSLEKSDDIMATDENGTTILPTLNVGNFPLKLSYITINQGSFVTERWIGSPTGTIVTGATNQALLTTDMKAFGEAVRVTGFSINLALSGGLLDSDVLNLQVYDDFLIGLGFVSSTIPSTNPRATATNLNYVVSNGSVGRVSVYVNIKPGAKGTIQASIVQITAQGFTSLANLSGADVTGNLLTVQ